MTNWILRLDLKDIYHANKPISELAALVAKRLREKRVPDDNPDLIWEQDEIVENFEELARDKNACAEDFDLIMEQLYDWADTPLDNAPSFERKKLCWVATF